METDPYIISTAADLAEFRDKVNNNEADTYAQLASDIDLSELSVDDSGWTPIGTYSVPYTGVFDGGGHEISGLYINLPGTDFVGLFGAISEGIVRNLTVRTAEADTGSGEYAVTGAQYVGIVAGIITNNSAIENCTAYGSVSGSLCVGGIAGSNVVTNKISGCVNYALVRSTGDYAGGITGYIVGTIENCTNNGEVSGGYTGGIVGLAAQYSIVKNCVNTADVDGGDGITGGIIGHCNPYVTIANCINIGNVTSTGSYVGAIVGHRNNTTVSNCGYLQTDEINNGLKGQGNGSSNGMTACDNAELMKSMITALSASIDRAIIASNGEARVTLSTSLGEDSFDGSGAVRSVTAESSNAEVATVSEDNLGATVSGVAAGYATITVKANFHPTDVAANISSGSLAFLSDATQVEFTYGVTVTEEVTSTGITIGGGGCNAGIGALALLALIPFALRRKK